MKPFSAILALLLSVFFLVAGNALAGLIVPLRAKIEGFSELSIGLLGSAYFVGMLAGALVAPAIVRRAGHIRAFSAFVAITVVVVILFPIWTAPAAWLVMRGALGFAFAGLYGVTESWINSKANNANRGALYGIYQIVTFGGSACGQLLLTLRSPTSYELFSIAGVLLALAIVPLAMTTVEPPLEPKSVRIRLGWLIRTSPVAALAAIAVGAANGAVWALGPVYALGLGLSPETVPWFTTAVVLGSAVGVYPAGRLSDRFDRRTILVLAAGLGALFEAALWRHQGGGASLVALGFAVGVTSFSLYTIAISHANDRASAEQLLLVSSGMLFLYCIGAILAPTIAAFMMRLFGPSALFAQNGLIHLALAAFALWRILIRQAPPAPALRLPKSRPQRPEPGIP
ncbi:MFS transporter [Methylocapsa sp. S129]|uniref:MFS transporter n=1 Tax=Methylocapsa sp. S129 TaxID=1641869 RepID=UPI00131BBD76|nr:MFS transporter [Methylocapsa sp. S129]